MIIERASQALVSFKVGGLGREADNFRSERLANNDHETNETN